MRKSVTATELLNGPWQRTLASTPSLRIRSHSNQTIITFVGRCDAQGGACRANWISAWRHLLNFVFIPFLTDYPLRVAIATLSESILRKTLFLKFLRIPHTHGVFRHFSTSLRRVPRRWRGPTADRATSGGRSAYPKVLEPVHFGAKHRRRNQYFIVHILVHF